MWGSEGLSDAIGSLGAQKNLLAKHVYVISACVWFLEMATNAHHSSSTKHTLTIRRSEKKAVDRIFFDDKTYETYTQTQMMWDTPNINAATSAAC